MSSSYRLSGAAAESLSLLATCLDMVNQFVRLDIDSSGLVVTCTDHDDTISIRYLLPVETIGDTSPPVAPQSVHIRCMDVVRCIQNAQGCVQITTDAACWTISDLAGNTTAWTTSVKDTRWTYPNTMQYDCAIQIPTSTFLLFGQHITLCESYVRVSSHGCNDITMHAEGEFLSIQIQNEAPGVPVVVGTHPCVVRCTFKYLRAVLSILQRVDQLTVCLVHGDCLFWTIPFSTGMLSVFIKDVPVY